MKKFLLLSVLITLCYSNSNANADTIIVVDDNNVVKQQIYTPTVQTVSTVQTQPVVVQQPQVVVTPPPVVVAQPQVVQTQPIIVRETPRDNNYYYDPLATAAVAGVTGIVLGSTLFGHHGPHPHMGHRR